MEMLIDKGARVDYYDPFIPHIIRTRQHTRLTGMESIAFTPVTLQTYDAVLIATNHSVVDYDDLVRHAQLVVDTRNATKDVKEGREKIVKA